MSRQYFAINFYDNCDWLVIEEIPMCDFKTAVALHLKKQSIFWKLISCGYTTVNQQSCKLVSHLFALFTKVLFHN